MPSPTAQDGPTASSSSSSRPSFKRFFTRGLAILLPTVITIGLVSWAYNFVDNTIAEPINQLVRYTIVRVSDYPEAQDRDYDAIWDSNQINPTLKRTWQALDESSRSTFESAGVSYTVEQSLTQQRRFLARQPEIRLLARQHALRGHWNRVRIGGFVVADLIGLVLAIVLIFSLGLILSNFFGRRLYAKGEEIINRVPLVRRVYPSVKQVTDFFFGEKESAIEFNRVVAVQYPRRGLWSIGLVTGDTMRTIQDAAGEECLTIFVPSSPTPFTGYVITVPVSDTVDLAITIEEALKFAVSGGVLIPQNQQIGPKSSAKSVSPTEDPDQTAQAKPVEVTGV